MKSLKVVALFVLALVALIAIVFVLAPSIAEYITFRKFREPERDKIWAEYREWRDRPLKLPAAALDVKPFGEQAKAAARAFDEAWAKHREAARGLQKTFWPESGNFAEASLDGLGSALAPLMPLLDAFAGVVDTPDYTMMAFGAARMHTDGGLPSPDFVAVLTCSRLLALRAWASVKVHKNDDALRDAELLFRSARIEPYDAILCQMISISICSKGTDIWRELVTECEDPDKLRNMLAKQNGFAGKLNFISDRNVSFMTLERLVILREIKRRGFPVELRNPTGRELMGLALGAEADYLEQIVLPFVKADFQAAEMARARIETSRLFAAKLGGGESRPGMLARWSNRLAEPSFYLSIALKFEGRAEQAAKAVDQFNALRRETERKLYTLEKGRAPARDEDLEPDSLTDLPEKPSVEAHP